MESQTSGTFQRKAHQWWTRGTRSSADRKYYSNKPVYLRKVHGKIRRNQESSCEKRIHWTLRAHILNLSFSSKGNFPNIWTSETRKSPLEQLIIDHNSLACETILSSCGVKVFKRTLMPMFVKGYHEAFLEFDLGLLSSFNIGQNQVNSILRDHWGKKFEEKTGLNLISPW